MVDEISDEEWDYLEKVALQIAFACIAIVAFLIVIALLVK